MGYELAAVDELFFSTGSSDWPSLPDPPYESMYFLSGGPGEMIQFDDHMFEMG